jgi:hypothetical protein
MHLKRWLDINSLTPDAITDYECKMLPSRFPTLKKSCNVTIIRDWESSGNPKK